MEIPSYVKTAVEILNKNGFEAYAVGGCVRDTLLGKTPHDWDMCTNALPEEICQTFEGFHVIKTGLKHGTVTVRIEHNSIEITTFRADGEYVKHRRPKQVNFVNDINEDLSRRDFTINALAYSQNGVVIDPFGGRDDLQKGIIRCVGDPEKRFDEDALRILRALRFSSTYAFEIEENTSLAIHKMKVLLLEISQERVRDELLKILCGKNVFAILEEYKDVIFTIIPEFEPTLGFEQHSPHHIYDVYHHIIHSVENVENRSDLRLAMLLHDIGKPLTFTLDENNAGHFKTHPTVSSEIAQKVLNRLKLDNKTKNYVVEQILEHDNRFNPDRQGVRRFVCRHDYDFAIDHLKIQKADIMAQSEYKRDEKLWAISEKTNILNALKEEGMILQRKDLKINGRDLLQMGFKPGRELKEILDYCLDGVLEEKFPNRHRVLVDEVRKNFSVHL